MKNTITLILCIGAWISVNAQNPGYFNRKNVVEFSLNGQVPLFANFAGLVNESEFKKVEGDYLVDKKDYFDYGFRFAYMRTFKRDFGAGIEFGYDYFSAQRPDRMVDTWGGGYYTQEYEKTSVSSMMIMPKLEFSNKGSVLPMGIAHQIGVGLRLVKPVDKQYHYAYSPEYGSGLPTEVMKIEDAYKGAAIKGMTFMYAVNMRTPLSKRLFLNYGLRYTLNFMSKASYYELQSIDVNDPTLAEAEFRNMARQRKQWSLIQASIGLSFAF